MRALKTEVKYREFTQNQIRKYILKGESDNPKLAELYKSSPQIKELFKRVSEFQRYD